MTQVLEAITVFDTDVATGAVIGTYTVRGGAATLRVTVEYDTSSKITADITPPSAGSPLANSELLDGINVPANKPRSFVMSAREGQKFEFKHSDGGTIKVKQFLVEEVRGGVI